MYVCMYPEDLTTAPFDKKVLKISPVTPYYGWKKIIFSFLIFFLVFVKCVRIFYELADCNTNWFILLFISTKHNFIINKTFHYFFKYPFLPKLAKIYNFWHFSINWRFALKIDFYCCFTILKLIFIIENDISPFLAKTGSNSPSFTFNVNGLWFTSGDLRGDGFCWAGTPPVLLLIYVKNWPKYEIFKLFFLYMYTTQHTELKSSEHLNICNSLAGPCQEPWIFLTCSSFLIVCFSNLIPTLFIICHDILTVYLGISTILFAPFLAVRTCSRNRNAMQHRTTTVKRRYVRILKLRIRRLIIIM